ncbi:hypothetical protein [Sphingopyxis witflariensis]|uniref:hypothetical protein n=1 Tax=Sphingopyxis witflariensis TaxID=173675 RepID=UPI001181A091|nr:hypothetical protein [Sphingopyxis witflariensis]
MGFMVANFQLKRSASAADETWLQTTICDAHRRQCPYDVIRVHSLPRQRRNAILRDAEDCEVTHVKADIIMIERQLANSERRIMPELIECEWRPVQDKHNEYMSPFALL